MDGDGDGVEPQPMKLKHKYRVGRHYKSVSSRGGGKSGGKKK